MLTSGFSDTPVTKTFLFSIIASSIFVSIADLKPFFYIDYSQLNASTTSYRYASPANSQTLTPSPPLPNGVFSYILRLICWQAAYANSTELLFAVMLLYHMRVVERMWGSQKTLSCLVAVALPSAIMTPLLLMALSHLTFSWASYLPSGPTAILFALLAQYHMAIPAIYRYKVVLSTNLGHRRSGAASHASQHGEDKEMDAITLSDKATTYLLAAQLALSALPGSLLPASIGWVLGLAWRNGWGPMWWDAWRIPSWTVGVRVREALGSSPGIGSLDNNFEGLSRRMDQTNGEASGMDRGTASLLRGEQRRRGLPGES